MRLFAIAICIFAASAAPLLLVGLLDPSSNPIGLGLLFVAGSAFAAMLGAFALVRLLWRLLAGSGNAP